MRIATSTMNNLTTGAMTNAYNKYAEIINKITSNRNFTKISENVPDATRVLKLNDQLARLNQYQSNIEAAENEMDLAYEALGDVSEEIGNINSIIIEASNITTTPDSAKAFANQIKEKLGTITDKMNQKYLDNYIFSGTYTQQKAYDTVLDADGNPTIEYLGSPKKAGERNLTIAEDTKFTYNITGEDIFGTNDDPDNFFKQMEKLDSLLREEPLQYDEIRKMIDVTANIANNVTQAQGLISSKVSKLEASKDINTSTITNLTEQKVNLEEVDITKAASDLASAYSALQASYQVGMSVLNNISLLNFL